MSILQQILDELSSPRAYLHDVSDVQVVQTHVSCVFLTGSFAYKIKKPVNFGFLNYGTLEQRRLFCHQEVRLNARLCPDVYLDIVPIVRRGGRLRVEGPGEIVEWAVKMRQLRDSDMLTSRLASGTLMKSDIERIACRLAGFHSWAAIGPTIRLYGEPGRVERAMMACLPSSDAVKTDVVRRDSRYRIGSFITRFVRENGTLLRSRMTSDRVRDCHGDLRAQNVCLDPRIENGVQIFDCVEFNDDFRFIDVASDLSYLAMDLDLAGRADLRRHLIATYELCTGDTESRRLMRFYSCYRACVRGEIALLTAGEEEVPDFERASNRRMASAAYDLADSYTRGTARPVLFMMVGYSGCGKSELAREIARRVPAILISSDRVRKRMVGVAPTVRLDHTDYSAEQQAKVYAEMRHRAEVCLSHGESVVLDGTFLSKKERSETAILSQRLGVDLWPVECSCSDRVIRERLHQRIRNGGSISDADVSIYEKQLSAVATPPDRPAGDNGELKCLTVDTSGEVEKAIRCVMDRFFG